MSAFSFIVSLAENNKSNTFHPFDASSELPYRVAMSSNHNGSDYIYGGHVEMREYADHTVAYCYTEDQATEAIEEAIVLQHEQNTDYNERR